MSLTQEQYYAAIDLIETYKTQQEEDFDDDFDDEQPCSICGAVEGFINQCCPNYDPLAFENCGYG